MSKGTLWGDCMVDEQVKVLSVEERLDNLEQAMNSFVAAVRAHTHDKDTGVAVVTQRL